MAAEADSSAYEFCCLWPSDVQFPGNEVWHSGCPLGRSTSHFRAPGEDTLSGVDVWRLQRT